MRLDSGTHAAVTLFAALNLLDIVSTFFGLRAGFTEVNRLPSMLLAAGGEPAMYLAKVLVTLVVIAIVIRLSPHFHRLWYGLQVANGILAMVVLLNTVQLLID